MGCHPHMQHAVVHTGMHMRPLHTSITYKLAMLHMMLIRCRYDLPSPPVAVRNLVEIAHYGHLCTMMSGMHHR